MIERELEHLSREYNCICGKCSWSHGGVIRYELDNGLVKLANYCKFTVLRSLLCPSQVRLLHEGYKRSHSMGKAVDITSDNVGELLYYSLLIPEFVNIVMHGDYIHIDILKRKNRNRLCIVGNKKWCQELKEIKALLK